MSSNDSDEQQPFSPLVGQVLMAMTAQTQATTNALISNLEYGQARAEATLELVREAIARLSASDVIRPPHMYLQALWPREEEIIERMTDNKKG